LMESLRCGRLGDGCFVVEFETAFEKAKAFYERLLGWIPQTRLPSKLREAYIFQVHPCPCFGWRIKTLWHRQYH
jgi:hypothetical protein